MTTGRLIAVVGPSGVGKDSVMAGIKQAASEIHIVRRVITRNPGLGGEDYDAVTPAQFEKMVRQGAFAVHWDAHGLRYGIPSAVQDTLRTGCDCLANFSRSALRAGAEVFPNFRVLSITARPETLAYRLHDRDRETPDEIEKRLAQARKPMPAGLDVVTIGNDGPLEETIAAALEQLQPVRT